MNVSCIRPAYTYIVECADATFYTGWTYDLAKRLAAHNSGKGSRYTGSRTPVRLRYAEKLPDKRAAQRREWEIKQLTRRQKQALIDNGGTGNYNNGDCRVKAET